MTKKAIRILANPEFRAELKKLNEAENKRIEITSEMQPLYDELLLKYDAEKKWSETYLLDNDIFDKIMAEKTVIDQQHGYFLGENCPVLVAENDVRNVLRNLIKIYADKVDKCFENITLNIGTYNEFKNLMLNLAKNN